MEHNSDAVFGRATEAAEEEPEAGVALTLKTSTSSKPEKAADATPVDAELLRIWFSKIAGKQREKGEGIE